MKLEPGTFLGPYRMLAPIGRGGMGEVWKALDRRLDRIVAVKLLTGEAIRDAEQLYRFRTEAKAVAALNHPNIVTLFSVEEVDDLPFITMELVEGHTLSEVIPDDGLTLERFFELALPLTDALSYAHRNAIVHRDLKPANVMIDGEGRVKILDFGLAKLRVAADETPSSEIPTASQSWLTGKNDILGTVPYMSPEQLQGKEVDHRTDLFSLGVLLFEMATGKRPFDGESSADLMSSILRDAPPAVNEIRGRFPNHLGRIIRRCLEKDAEQRYQSARDIHDELRHLWQEVSQTALPAKIRLRRRVRPWVPLAGLGAVVLVFASIWLLNSPAPDTDTTGSTGAVAVFPFANLTGRPDGDYLSEGISSALITRLGEVSGIQVVGRTAAASAERLGVGVYVEGEVQRSDDRLSINVKLTDSDTGLVLWSEVFQGSTSELFELQERIASAMTAVLSIPLSDRERRRLARNPTRSLAAYDYFLRGHQKLRDRSDARGADTAVEMFRQAIRLDPDFALARAGLSEGLWRVYRRDRVGRLLEEAETQARRALEADPELPAAQVALARVLRATGRYGASIEELRKVLAAHPKPDEAQRELAASYRQVGDLEEAERCLRAAVALGGNDWFNWNALGSFLLELGRYEEAREALERASTVSPPEVSVPDENLAALTVLQGRFDEAVEIFERIPRPIRSAQLASNIATAHYFAGAPDGKTKAEEYYRLAMQLDPHSTAIRRNLADVLADLGRRDEARHHYREALRLTEERLENDPNDSGLLLDRAIYAAKAGECDTAAPLAERLADELAETASNAHLLAQALALCGRPAEAIERLRAAIRLGFSPEILDQESEFASLREDPEFARLTGGAERP